MLACFRELGINATIVKAVDGKYVNVESIIEVLGNNNRNPW